MDISKKLNYVRSYAAAFVKWGLLGLLVGILGGCLGVLFHYTLGALTQFRGAHPWILFLLPVGGLLTVGLYRRLKLSGNKGTNEIIEATLDGHYVSPAVTPAIFLATCLTHFFGGSAGREGAALQLGGSLASLVAQVFHIRRYERKILVMAGMSAVFTGLFGTPLTAMMFCMEFESVGTFFSPALFPCFVSSMAAGYVSRLLGVYPEAVDLTVLYTFTPYNGGRYLLLALGISLLSIFMCWFIHKAEHLSQELMEDPKTRILVGSILLVALTLALGDQRFNGAGMDMALDAVNGQADWYSFLVKLLFTAITLSAGFKGGEIVPTFCIGATFGCVWGGLLGLDPGFSAALGLVGLFCCVTNSPLASIVLSVEMFGGANVYTFTFVSIVCFVLSGNSSLYSSQVMVFDKTTLPRPFRSAQAKDPQKPA